MLTTRPVDAAGSALAKRRVSSTGALRWMAKCRSQIRPVEGPSRESSAGRCRGVVDQQPERADRAFGRPLDHPAAASGRSGRPCTTEPPWPRSGADGVPAPRPRRASCCSGSRPQSRCAARSSTIARPMRRAAARHQRRSGGHGHDQLARVFGCGSCVGSALAVNTRYRILADCRSSIGFVARHADRRGARIGRFVADRQFPAWAQYRSPNPLHQAALRRGNLMLLTRLLR
jgi:hypothetical protein